MVKFVNSQANTTTLEKLSGKLLPNQIIDLGVTHHITWKLELLFDVKDIPLWLVTLPNGKFTIVQKCGKINFGKYLVLEDV